MTDKQPRKTPPNRKVYFPTKREISDMARFAKSIGENLSKFLLTAGRERKAAKEATQ